MIKLIIAAIISVVAGIISLLWVNGIDNMKKNHPDYKGDDFLNG
jgi:hypothetical protein